MKRNEFIKRSALLATFGLPLISALSSCSTEEPVTPGTTLPNTKDCLANGTNSIISSNHGHSIVVSKTDVENGVEKSYAIQSGASHNHDVIITAANFASLKNKTSIEVTSTSADAHSHSVSVSCA